MTAIVQPSTIGGLLAEAEQRLADRRRDAPALRAGHVMAALVACPRLELFRIRDRRLTDAAAARYRRDIGRLCRGMPLQYVTGRAAFRRLDLACDARALIPRPETEALVQAVLEDERLNRLAAPRIVDVGTGSGCIALALASEAPGARVTATEVDSAALDLARANARALGREAAIHWRLGDLLENFAPRSADLVVANLPYIPSAAWASLPEEVRDYEPRRALDGGIDGMDLIRRLLAQAVEVLDRGGAVFLETGEDQTERTAGEALGAGSAGAAVLPDLAGRPRIVRAAAP